MNILITVDAGFIDSRFIHYMLAKYPEYRIVCLDKLTYAGNLATLQSVIQNPGFRFVKPDICDREAVAGLFAEEHPDMVVNFAAETLVDHSISAPVVFLRTNIIGTGVLLDACRKHGNVRFRKLCMARTSQRRSRYGLGRRLYSGFSGRNGAGFGGHQGLF